MSKGTPSQGKKARAKLHYKCRRCGKNAYHKKTAVCSNCGYGKTSKIRKYAWQKKHYLKRLSSVKRNNKIK